MKRQKPVWLMFLCHANVTAKADNFRVDMHVNSDEGSFIIAAKFLLLQSF